METKKEYIAPTLTVVSFKMEHGYAASGLTNNLRLFLDQFEIDGNLAPGYNSYAQQKWEDEGDGYFGSGW